jgi:hypothetical protein
VATVKKKAARTKETEPLVRETSQFRRGQHLVLAVLSLVTISEISLRGGGSSGTAGYERVSTADPDKMGVVISRGCDEAIDWQINTAARCCCEQNL